MDPIQHIVLYSFQATADLQSAMEIILGLKDKAMRNGKSYILDIRCGSTRPAAPVRSRGFNLASVTTFASEEDRLYFVKDDEAHQELIAFVSGKLAKDILVLDFITQSCASASSQEDC
ncbi:hypothetical protein GQ53DRAFT_751613 [Thozetella sp. PMI_491]|nr:hypothetical protein GQ53DRAFT_751613 [Thozetella sp. PMI_491]